MAETNTLRMDETRVTYPGCNSFRPFVLNELERRKKKYPTPMVTPFVRMTACTSDPNNHREFFTLGLHGFSEGDFDMFDVSYGSRKEVVGYSYADGKKKLHSTDMLSAATLPPGFADGLSEQEAAAAQAQRAAFQEQQTKSFLRNAHPVPGITNVSISRKGPFAPFIATVNWQCYNRAQLEFLRHHFMNVGQYVVVEWGNQYSDRPVLKTLEFGDKKVIDHLVSSITEGRQYIIDEFVEKNDGNYDFIVGAVGQFTIDMDPKTGIYNCGTTVVSTGELIYGINNHFTYVDTDSANPNKTQPITTYSQYFTIGQAFDALVHSEPDGAYVSKYVTSWEKNATDSSQPNKKFPENHSSNPQDYRFVSWKFFTEKLLPELFFLINSADYTLDINKLFDFSHTETVNRGKIDPTIWVGYDVNLQSTDPDSILIVNKNSSFNPPEFITNGFFGDHATDNGNRGKLSQGVWLNTGMIRRSFLETNDLVSAIKRMLVFMNNATANFWHLSLIWDDEIGKWRIVDQKFTDPSKVPTKYYTFNKILPDQSSDPELLNVKMDSTFPPELITQTMLYSRYKSASPEEQRRLIKTYPKIGSTSTFIFSLNWTSLTDILAGALQNSPAYKSNVLLNTQVPNTEQDTARSHVVSGLPSFMGGAITVTGNSNTQSGHKINGNTVATKENLDSNNLAQFSNFTPRSSLKAVNPAVPDDLNVKGDGVYGKAGKGHSLTSLRLTQPKFRNSIMVLEHMMKQYYSYEFIYTATTRNLAYELNLGERGYPIASDPAKSYHLTGQAVDINLRDIHTKNSIRLNYNRAAWLKLKNCVDTFNASVYAKDRNSYAKLKLIDSNKEYHHIQIDEEVEGLGPVVPDIAYVTGYDYSSSVGSASVPVYYQMPIVSIKDGDNGLVAESDREFDAKGEDIYNRFGDGVIPMIALDPSSMIALITKNGYDNPMAPNGFVTGFPTTTSVDVEIVGLSGISISDIFSVEKLPYIFDQYGAFQVTDITDTITRNGWVTKVRGYFKLIWIMGKPL